METQTPNQPSQPQAMATAPVEHDHAPHRYVCPRAHITEAGDAFAVQVEMPGVPPAGLEITFADGGLTIVGHRSHGTGDHAVVYRESHANDYRRTFELDGTIDAGRITARLDQGLLTLTLPKSEAAKPRRIEIGGLN